jgi:hypothetical protein
MQLLGLARASSCTRLRQYYEVRTNGVSRKAIVLVQDDGDYVTTTAPSLDLCLAGAIPKTCSQISIQIHERKRRIREMEVVNALRQASTGRIPPELSATVAPGAVGGAGPVAGQGGEV